ncbi:unnamed protein product [Linum tenue]|uniref:Glycosyltransferase N-terminal domain-containing protein n=2 Tax=Linum tenue TaxID=586396 RepID=A0AAV0RIP3_9ROSI|nr:unnamed protein product [Linum tenue]
MATADDPTGNLHVAILPFMAHGHMIPIIDIAKLFASRRGVKTTIITTRLNAPLVSKQIPTTAEIHIELIRFPAAEAGVPEESETADFFSSTAQKMGPNFLFKFFHAAALLRRPLDAALAKIRPDCLVSDAFFPWSAESAGKFGIPRLVFHGTGYFALCTAVCIRVHKPHKNSDSESFVVPCLPGKIELTPSQLPESARKEEEGNPFTELVREMAESEGKSYGVIVNSFRELEPNYADFYRDELGRRNWAIGPVSLSNRRSEEKAGRGGRGTGESSSDCLKWLESKEPDSVIYICFGSLADFADSQLKEIAAALESWGGSFIWVVRKDPRTESESESEEEWLPVGFEDRTAEKGLIIRGWAPQILILDHEAVGGFVTHCGWNSTLEGITVGKAMVTWPVAAEQFYNEKLVTAVLGIGLPVEAEKWVRGTGDDEVIMAEGIEIAVRRLMDGDEGKEMRRKAKELREMARMAIEEGGSSHSSLSDLIDELKQRSHV